MRRAWLRGELRETILGKRMNKGQGPGGGEGLGMSGELRMPRWLDHSDKEEEKKLCQWGLDLAGSYKP